jgi:hypothetical protein
MDFGRSRFTFCGDEGESCLDLDTGSFSICAAYWFWGDTLQTSVVAFVVDAML